MAWKRRCCIGLKKPDLLNIIAGYEGLAVRSATKADKDVIAAAKKLKVIGRAGIGVDNIDIPAATARGIVVMNTPFGNSITTAEHAVALMFAAARQIAAADASTQAGKWEKSRLVGVELYAKTLGLIGCGNIGCIGRRARARAQDEGDRLRSFPLARACGQARGGESRAGRSAFARRHHFAAHPFDRQDQEHPVGRGDRQERKKASSS